jgi:hypothetical protein
MTDITQTTDDPDEAATDHLDDADEDDSAAHREHLEDVEDGCGCTEIWEHLSENREEAADD